MSCDPRQAAELRRLDGELERALGRTMSVLTDEQWKHGSEPAVHVTLLARSYERLADHAVEIGRRVIVDTAARFDR